MNSFRYVLQKNDNYVSNIAIRSISKYIKLTKISSREKEERRNSGLHLRIKFYKILKLTGIIGLSTLAIWIPLFLYKQTERIAINANY